MAYARVFLSNELRWLCIHPTNIKIQSLQRTSNSWRSHKRKQNIWFWCGDYCARKTRHHRIVRISYAGWPNDVKQSGWFWLMICCSFAFICVVSAVAKYYFCSLSLLLSFRYCHCHCYCCCYGLIISRLFHIFFLFVYLINLKSETAFLCSMLIFDHLLKCVQWRVLPVFICMKTFFSLLIWAERSIHCCWCSVCLSSYFKSFWRSRLAWKFVLSLVFHDIISIEFEFCWLSIHQHYHNTKYLRCFCFVMQYFDMRCHFNQKNCSYSSNTD